MNQHNLWAALTCTALLGATGCVQGDDAPDYDTTGDEVIGGTAFPAEGSGYVRLSSTIGSCTGTLMSNTWVLTARHCFGAGDVATPSVVTASMGSQSSTAAQVVLYANDDVALMRLSTPFAMNGSTTGFERSLYPYATNTLAVGTVLTCRGFGISDWNAQTGAGTLRTADLPVRGVNFLWWGEHYDLAVDHNGQGQFLAFGDSGGSCLFTLPGGEQVVTGVTSTVYREWDGAFNGLISADTFRAWYFSILPPDWRHIGHANGVTAMAGLNGKLFVATADNRLWWRDAVGHDINWAPIGHADNVVAMTAINSKLFAVTTDDRLWWRDPIGADVPWVHIGHAHGVVAMTALDGKLFAATSDNRLWWRDPVGYDVDWVQIGHANGVVGMAATNGKLFAATSDNRLWSRDPVGHDVDWVEISHANWVVAMAATNGKLFAVTSDNLLWWRDPVR